MTAADRDEAEALRRRLEALERERAELLARAERAEVADRIALVGRGIAHDLNNVVASIMGLASFLRSAAELPPEGIEDIEGMLDACGRASELTRGLLALSSEASREVRRADAGRLLSRAATRSAARFAPGTLLDLDVPTPAPVLRVVPSQVEGALEAILDNALEALDGRGAVVASVAEVHLGADDLAGHPHLTPGQYVRFRIDDDGPGMDVATARQAIRPFFSTRGPGRRGLGLAYVHGVVRGHRGRAMLDSCVGEGTTVVLELPVRSETPPFGADGAP